METDGIILIVIIALFLWFTISKIFRDIADNKEEKEKWRKIESTPIEVHKYTYQVTMCNGEKFLIRNDNYIRSSFETFSDTVIGEEYTTYLDDINESLNNNLIVKAKLMNTDTREIYPIITTDYYGHKNGIKNVYTDKMVIDRAYIGEL